MVKRRFLIVVQVLAAIVSLAGDIETHMPGWVFAETEEAQFRLPVVDGAEWRLQDRHGRTIREGRVPQDGCLSLGVLGCGYYRLSTMTGGVVCCGVDFPVVPNPATTYRGADSAFGIDAAFSWVSRPGKVPCPWKGGDNWRVTAGVLAKLGLSHVRERLRWSEVNPKPGTWQREKYHENLRLLRENGLLVTDVFHDAPSFAGWSGGFPLNPVSVRDFCRRIATDFGKDITMWEFMNEEDAGAGPAWDYAVMMRAAFLGFKDGAPQVDVSNGGFCRPCANVYHDVMGDNALAGFSDVLNLHTYASFRDFSLQVADARKMLSRWGVPDREIVYTEMGCGAAVGYASTPVPGRPGEMQLSSRQEFLLAESYPKAQIEMMLAGVSRTYFFVWGFYREQRYLKDFGTLRIDGTVRPVVSTLAVAANALSGARPVGRLAVPEGLSAVLFAARDGTQTVAYWKQSAADGNTTDSGPMRLKLAVADGMYSGRDGFGARQAFLASGGVLELSADEYVSYVFGLKGLSAAEAAVSRGRGGARPFSEDVDREIVCRVLPDARDFKTLAQNAKTELLAETGRVRVEVWNLGNEPRTGVLTVGGGRLDGLPQSLTVPPRDSVAVDAVYVPSEGGEAQSQLSVGGTFSSRRIVPTVVPVRIKTRLFASLQRVSLDWTDPDGWTENDSATLRSKGGQDGELSFTCIWADPSKDRWTYPRRAIRSDELRGARFIEFDVRTRQNKPENDFMTCCVFLHRTDGRRERVIWEPPSLSWETRRIELPCLPDGVSYTVVEIGCNPKGTELKMDLKDFGLLKSK